MTPKAQAIVAGALLLVGLVAGWCGNNARWEHELAKARDHALATRDTLQTLRADSASLAQARKTADSIAVEKGIQADSVTALARKQAERIAGLRKATQEATRALDSARTTTDSLTAFGGLTVALRRENDSLWAVSRALDSALTQEHDARLAAVELQRADSARADNAEARAASLARLNADLQRQLARPGPFFTLPNLHTVGVVAVAVGGFCLVSHKC